MRLPNSTLRRSTDLQTSIIGTQMGAPNVTPSQEDDSHGEEMKMLLAPSGLEAGEDEWSSDAGLPSPRISPTSRAQVVGRIISLSRPALGSLCVAVIATVVLAASLVSAKQGRTNRALPFVLVGPRHFTPRYRPACNIAQVLSELHDTKVRPDGMSRQVDFTPAPTDALPHFAYSFDLQACAAPHVYTSAEACDLISSFGGIFMRGDSHVRMVHYALLMLLSNSTDGAGYYTPLAPQLRCRGDNRFRDRINDDGLDPCYSTYYWSTHDPRFTNQRDYCGGKAYTMYSDAPTPANVGLEAYHSWLFTLPSAVQSRSPIMYQGGGVRFASNVAAAEPYFADTDSLYMHSFPRPLSIWSGIHATGTNMALKYQGTQGRPAISAFDLGIEAMVSNRSTSGGIWEGSTTVIPFYNASLDAFSWDGQHYSYQVNMEKVQMMLNILDLTWVRIVEEGGLVDSLK